MKRILRAIALGLALAACGAGGAAVAFPGEPLLQRFTPADFKATPYLFSLVRDGEGRFYVGNSDGVLRLQGREWTTLALPGGMAAGSLARGTDGRVYLSGHDSFGYLDTDPEGRAVYHDLRDAFGLKGSARALGWMGSVLPVSDGVYFRAQRTLLYYGFDGTRKQWPMAEDNSGFAVWKDDLYTLDMSAGLLRFDAGRLVPVPGGTVMREHRGIEIVDHGDFAVVVSVGGFYRLDQAGVQAMDVPPMPADAGIFTTLKGLPDGGFVVATAAGVLLHYDAGAHLRARHTIARSPIAALETDPEGGLWATSDDELVRMQLPSPWSRIDTADLGGVIGDCEWHRDALWLAVGVKGLARLRESGGEVHTDWIAAENRNQIFALRSTEDGLLVARDGGIDVIGSDDKVERLFKRDQPVFGLVRSHFDPDLIYAPGDEGVHVLRRHEHRWAYVGLMPAPELATQSLFEVAPGVLWVNNTRGLPERWLVDPVQARIRKRERFALQGTNAIPDPNQSAQVDVLDKDVFVTIGRAAYRFDGHAFVPYAGEPFSLMQNPNAFVVLDTPVGAFVYTGNRLYRRGRDQRWRREDLGSQPMASQTVLRYGNDGVLRMSVWRGLLQFRPDAAATTVLPPLAVRLTAVRRADANGNSVLLPLQDAGSAELAQDQSLSLQFSLFNAEPGVEYRYRIPGLMAGWSEWRDQSALALGNVDQPGEHTVEIEARTPNGRPVQPVRYAFTVAPRWYQITVVRLSLLLVGLIALWGFVRWREHRQVRVYRQRQQFLEAKIAERTAELETANHKLAELATEDSLTGIANRRALEAALQREFARCLTAQVPIGLLMIDVDHFKQYNDRFGHQAGDEVLRDVAQRLSAGLDPTGELLARYGGEEFCLLLPGMDATAAAVRAERLRSAFSGTDAQVTISLGVAAQVPQAGGSAQDLLRAADEQLYAAKRHGRNRVEVAGA